MSFLAIVAVALFLPAWVFALTACAYAFIFAPYELLVLGVLVDAQFGSVDVGAWYWYTAIASVLLIASAYLRPHLSFYGT